MKPMTLIALATVVAACAKHQPDSTERVQVPPTTEEATTTRYGLQLERGVALSIGPEIGAFLTDGDGRSLYLLEEDPTGESACYDACAAAWPPVLVDARPDALDPAVQSDLFGTLRRSDGTTQLTYAGHPLYYYAKDNEPGDIMGHHLHDAWGEWYLVGPDGTHVEARRGS